MAQQPKRLFHNTCTRCTHYRGSSSSYRFCLAPSARTGRPMRHRKLYGSTKVHCGQFDLDPVRMRGRS